MITNRDHITSIVTNFCKMASSSSMFSPLLYVLSILFMISTTTLAGFHVKTLPGFTGELPFYMETGYISVGDVEYFYYFVESQSNPSMDPLLLFINGGPGCSALNGFFYEIGPLLFQAENFTGGTPTLMSNPDAWTQTANIIFLDAPVGTGYTYSTTTQGWNSNHTFLAHQLNIFARKWLYEHTSFLGNAFYLATDSFVGVVNPIAAQDIMDGNKDGLLPYINIKGLSLSCPHTNQDLETDTGVVLSHRLGLISDELYETARTSCNGTYSQAPNEDCTDALDAIKECTKMINGQNTLLPLCAELSPKDEDDEEEDGRRSLGEKFALQPHNPIYSNFYCKNSIYQLSYIWANLEATRAALGIRTGTVERWVRCNITLNGYSNDVTDAFPYHKNLTKTGLQLLVFSGDHDMVVPYLAIQDWIRALDISVDQSWRAWFVDGQVAGYTFKYSNYGYRLTFATVKGAGHSPPEYKPKECYELFNRWVHYYPV